MNLHVYIHIVIWKGIVLTVIASSKHTKPQFVLSISRVTVKTHQIWLLQLRIPSNFSSHYKTNWNALSLGGGKDLIAATLVVTVLILKAPWPPPSCRMFSPLYLLQQTQHTLSPGLKSIKSQRSLLDTWWNSLYSRAPLFS